MENNRKIFFSDLDKTLLMSGFPNEKCVEYKTIFQYNDQKVRKKITYMTEKAYEGMQEVLKRVLFIPTTMRNLEQTKRIEWIQEYNPKYIICSNGCEIYADGELDEEWNEIVREQISYKLVEEANDRGNYIENLDIVECRNVNGFYFVWKLKEDITEEQKKILNFFIPNGFRIQIDGKKAFFLQESFHKAKAIEFLLQKYKLEGEIFVAGDSEADREMLELPYVHSLLPRHSKLELNKEVFVTEHEYLKASEDIIKKILEN